MSQEELNFREEVFQYMIESGEQEKIQNFLKKELFSGLWKEEVTKLCKKIITDVGIDNVTFDMLIEQVEHQAKEMVPESVKDETLKKIRSSINAKFNSS